MEESNGSDEESDNENPEVQNDQPPTETKVAVAALHENPVIGNRGHKLVGELFQKIGNVKLRCSNSLLSCLVKMEGQLKTEARQLRKEGQQVDGILKEAILQESDNDEVDDRDRNAFELFE